MVRCTVQQGLDQGCLLARLLSNISFDAVLRVIRQRFGEEPEIQWYLVQVDERVPEGETRGQGKFDDPFGAVRQDVRDTLFADVAGILSLTSQGLGRAKAVGGRGGLQGDVGGCRKERVTQIVYQ